MKKNMLSMILVVAILSTLCVGVSAGKITASFDTSVALYNGALNAVPTGWTGSNILIQTLGGKVGNYNGSTVYRGQIIYDGFVCNGPINYSVQANNQGWDPVNHIAKLIFYYQDDNNYYYLSIGGASTVYGKVKLYKRVNGVETQLGATYTLVKYAAWDDTEIINVDSQGNFSVTIVQTGTTYSNVITATDVTFTTGKIGLAVDAVNGKNPNKVDFRRILLTNTYNMNTYTENFSDITKVNNTWTNFGTIPVIINSGCATVGSDAQSGDGTPVFVLKNIPFSQNFVYSLDLKTSGSLVSNKARVIFNFDGTASSFKYNFIDFDGGTNADNPKVRVGRKHSTTGENTYFTSANNYVSSDAWVHVEVGYEASSGKITVYATKNGVKTKLFDSVYDANMYNTGGCIGVGTKYSNSQFDNINLEYEDLAVIKKDLLVNGTPIGAITDALGQTVTASVAIGDNTVAAKPGVMIVGLYDENGELKAAGVSNAFSIATTASTTVTASFAVPSGVLSTWQTKLFLWDDLTSTIRPIITKKSL